MVEIRCGPSLPNDREVGHRRGLGARLVALLPLSTVGVARSEGAWSFRSSQDLRVARRAVEIQVLLPLSDIPLFWRVPEHIGAELSSVMTLAFTYRQPFDVLAALLGSTHEAITTQNRERLAYTSVALWILSNRLYDDERMMEGLWAALPERHIRAFARNTLGLVGELGVDAHLQEATRSIREIQRNAL